MTNIVQKFLNTDATRGSLQKKLLKRRNKLKVLSVQMILSLAPARATRPGAVVLLVAPIDRIAGYMG